MVEKLYYSMGEVTEMFDVEPSLIRYWCSQFTCLRPKRNAKGNRMFTPQDVERLKRIYHLLKEKKMTIEGAQKAMRKKSVDVVEKDSDIALLEQLQRVRAMLVEMRNTIGDESSLEGDFASDADEQSTVVAPTAAEVDKQAFIVATPAPVVEVVEEAVADEPVAISQEVDAPEPSVATTEESATEAVVEPVAEVVSEAQEVKEVGVSETPVATPKKKRATRRKSKGEEGVVERPLFPFFEQTLF